ncbi:putative RNA-binding protein 46 [Pseudolycoriella hygida]|uniref:RNA-binding protein 46 n=1 Tax=Pseudolycoriella hygida TaxID=35572 RepID=A0A9Q0NAE7_9DIPT|nr:putative RNA-binding protein 46 [Pseudolycoriella hygida]
MSHIRIGEWAYSQIQINGERITTNVSFLSCSIPSTNPIEVFVNRIPYKMYEDNLIPLFETIGVVAQFRLMMDYSGQNRGFGFLIYVRREDAQRAITYLDNILVSSWCRLQLCISKNNRRLWLGKINDDLDVDTAIQMILEKVNPLEIILSKRNFRRCFLLKFETHRDAAISRKILLREKSIYATN